MKPGNIARKRAGIPIGLSKSKASSDFLKTKIWKLQTNRGDPKLFKSKRRNRLKQPVKQEKSLRNTTEKGQRQNQPDKHQSKPWEVWVRL